MRRMMLVGALTLALVGGTVAPAAAALDARSRPSSPVYLALGDSVPAGVGATPGVSGYPELLEALLDSGYNPAANKATGRAQVDFELINLAIPGERTDTFIDRQLAPAVAVIEERNGNRNPLDDVEVVTLTLGGNDLFGPAVANCIATTNPAGCQAAVDVALVGMEARISQILSQLVTAAGIGTEVVVTTYYNPIGSCFLSMLNPAAEAIADIALDGGTLPGVLTLSRGLNDVLRDVAAATGAQVAELYGELDDAPFVGDRDCLHPNAEGHRQIADLVYGTLAR